MKISTKVFHWIPRIICILTTLFVSLFALDSFSSDRTFWQNTAAFLMHLIPSFVLIVLLIVAWKWEKVGGILLTIIGLVWCIFVFMLNYNRTHSLTTSLMIIMTLCIPFVLAGILFILSHNRRKKELSGV
jgi:prolipoprotein diacylglyceryltransferase